MGQICSKSAVDAPLHTGNKEITSLKSVKIKPANFVKENTKNFYEIYSLQYPPLGSGAWGEVRKCVHRVTQEARVAKIVKKIDMPEEYIKTRAAINEAMVLKKLDHPNLPRIYEFFEDEANYFIVIEYLKGGDLFDRIIDSKKFSEEQVATIMQQLLMAVNHLHSKGIVHRDIKPENIMMVDKNSLDIKLADFDTATVFKGANIKQMLGTPLYMAPEVIKGRYDEKCDLWSCGIIFYILLKGSPPYNGSDDEIFEILKSVKIKFTDPYWQTVSPAALDLLQKLLEPNKKDRISAAEACSHEWFDQTSQNQVSDINFEQVIQNIKNFNSENKIKDAVHTFIISKIVDQTLFKNEMNLFKSLDKDKDGTISKEELKAMMIKNGMPEEEAIMNSDLIFEKVDVDQSGALDYTEFLRASVSRNKYLTRENIVKAFEMFDQDRSGSIEVEEIKHWLGEDRTATQELVTELLKPIDGNEDGKINLDEFENYMIQGVRRRTTYFKEKMPIRSKNSKNFTFKNMENCILALSCAVLSVGLALFYRYPEVLYVSVLLIIFACLFLIWLFLRKIVSYCLFPGSLWFFSRSLELLYSKEISLQVFKKLEKLKIYLIDLNSQKFEETFHFDSSSKKLVNTLIENFQTMQNISSNQQKFQTLLMSLKTYIEHISIKCNTEEMNFWSYLDGNHNREVEYFSYILNDQNQEYVKKSISTINSLQNMLKKHFESKSCFSKFLQYFQSITIGTLDYMRSDLMNRFYCEQNLINNAIDSIYIKCDEDSDSAVMICNPNAGFYEFIYFQSEWLEFYLSRGINVILWNYRGYGLSKGRPHVRQNVEDGKKVIEFYLTSKKIQKFSLHGESIGGTVAIQLAQDSRCQFILADRTFGCLSDVIKYGYGKFAYFMYRLTLLPDINNTQTYLQLKCYKVITSDPCDKIIPDFVSLKSSVALAFIGKVSMSPGTYLARQSYKSLNHILSYTELCQFTCTLSTLLTKYLKLIDEEPFDKRKTTLKTEINEDHDRLTHLKFINLLSSIDSCGVTLKSAVFHKYCCFVMSIWLLSLELWGSFNGFLFSLDLSSISASLSDLKECIGYINKLQSHGDYLQFKNISLTLEKIQNYIQVTLQRTSSSHRDVLCTRDYSAAGAFMLVNCGHGGHFNNMNRHNLHIHLVQSSFILINPQPVCP